MLTSFLRKGEQVARDPVLRRWLVGRALGQVGRGADIRRAAPPYLDVGRYAGPREPAVEFAPRSPSTPSGSLSLALPGETVSVAAGAEDAAMVHPFADIETELALHRFAWVPLQEPDPAWVGTMWRAWVRRFGGRRDGWAWHPYTAAERAINILGFAARHGLPGDTPETARLLADHGRHILDNLEYFGDGYTSNHLSNDGRGVYTIGLAFGIDDYADAGARILIEEARRIFLPSGILREGSSHYHLLLLRNYTGAWLAARRRARPETKALEAIVARAFAAVPGLALPGGLPLVGDVSPDCPPDFLACLVPGADAKRGWAGSLAADEREAMIRLRDSTPPAGLDALGADGWHRLDAGSWSFLCHIAPEGWPPMPGHGHQDIGGFELHFEDEIVFRDLGRRSYGPSGDADTAAATHNGLTVDGEDPYPRNRPHYDASFRRAVGGSPPEVSRRAGEIALIHQGYRRLRGVGAARRAWRFDGRWIGIEDAIEGQGPRVIARRLHTALPVERTADGAILRGRRAKYKITVDARLEVKPTILWESYGSGIPATAIEMTAKTNLPWRGMIGIEAA